MSKEAQSEAPNVETFEEILIQVNCWCLHDRGCTIIEEQQKAIAKINRLIVEAELKGFNIAFDCHDYDRLRAYKEQLTKELGDSNER